jgi:hypothetical protein
LLSAKACDAPTTDKAGKAIMPNSQAAPTLRSCFGPGLNIKNALKWINETNTDTKTCAASG